MADDISAPVNGQLDPDCPPVLGMRSPGQGNAVAAIAEEPGDILQWEIEKRGRYGDLDQPPFYVVLRSQHLQAVTGDRASESLIVRPAGPDGTVLATSWDLHSDEANAVFVAWWRTLMEFKARRPSEFPDAPEGAQSPVDGMESIPSYYEESSVTSANEQASSGLTMQNSVDCGTPSWMAELWRKWEIRARQAPRGSVLGLPGSVPGGEQERLRALRDIELMERLAAANPPAAGIVMPGPPNHPLEPRELHQRTKDQVPSSWPAGYTGPLSAVPVGGIFDFDEDGQVPEEFQTTTGGGGGDGSTTGTGSTDDESTSGDEGSDTEDQGTTEEPQDSADEPTQDETGGGGGGGGGSDTDQGTDDGTGTDTGNQAGNDAGTDDGAPEAPGPVADPGERLGELWDAVAAGETDRAVDALTAGRVGLDPLAWPLWLLALAPLAAWWIYRQGR